MQGQRVQTGGSHSLQGQHDGTWAWRGHGWRSPMPYGCRVPEGHHTLPLDFREGQAPTSAVPDAGTTHEPQVFRITVPPFSPYAGSDLEGQPASLLRSAVANSLGRASLTPQGASAQTAKALFRLG